MIATAILSAPSIPTTLFGEPTLIGLRVELTGGNQCCGNTIAEIHPGKGPHAGELRCIACGSHRGWLSKVAADWLHAVIRKFGWPTKPIRITQQKEKEIMAK